MKIWLGKIVIDDSNEDFKCHIHGENEEEAAKNAIKKYKLPFKASDMSEVELLDSKEAKNKYVQYLYDRLGHCGVMTKKEFLENYDVCGRYILDFLVKLNLVEETTDYVKLSLEAWHFTKNLKWELKTHS